MWDLGNEQLIRIIPLKSYFLVLTKDDKGTSEMQDDAFFLSLSERDGTPIWERKGILKWPFEWFDIFADDECLGIFMGNNYLYFLDIHSGKILASYTLSRDNSMGEIKSFLRDRQRTFLSGEPMMMLSNGTLRDTWNWVRVWRINKDWNIIDTSLKKGLVIGGCRLKYNRGLSKQL